MDTVQAVEAAQTQEVFDVLSFIEKTAYPREKVALYTDVDAAHEYVRLVDERAKLELEPEGTKALEITSLTEQIEALGEKIKGSTLVFELQGMPPGMVKGIIEETDGESELPDSVKAEMEIGRDNVLIAKTIQNVTNGHGARDPRVWEPEHVEALRTYINQGEFAKLLRGVSNVNFNAAIFEAASDAGFSGGGSDLGA